MMQALADFAASDAGLLYARVCERWHTDPGAPFAEDEITAYNARVAFAHYLAHATGEDASQPSVETYPDGHTVVSGLDPFDGR